MQLGDVSCVCLAAGRSSRILDKPLKKIGDEAVIESDASQLSRLSFKEILAITGGETEVIAHLLRHQPVRIVENQSFAIGMTARSEPRSKH